MASNLEVIGINERSGLITPNLYKQDWTVPSNVLDNYSVVHTRALSDTTTPIYGKGTGIFLDTTNGGGDYDINGNTNYLGSGRLNAFSINTAQWSYSPATPYSVTNTRALSDATTPIYGKGTGIFLDTTNGGGDYDINGNQINYPGSGRLNAFSINTAQWSYSPITPYSVTNTRALSDATTPIYGKGTGIFLDTANGGGDYDINGNQINYPGSGRVPLMALNYSIWTFDKTNFYATTHPHALAGTDVHGKGTSDSTVLGASNEFVLPAHTNYNGGSSDDVLARKYDLYSTGNIYYVNVLSPSNPTNWYTMSHPNAKATGDIKGKGTNDGMGTDGTYAAHTNYNGGGDIDINGNPLIPGSGRIPSNTTNFTINAANKPFGYGYLVGQGYDSSYPICSNASNTINVGLIHW